MSNRSERRLLDSIGAKTHTNSGRGWVTKADGSDALFVWDVKESRQSFHINSRVWDKICSDAYHNNPYKNPGLFIVLGEHTELALIEMSALQELIKQVKELSEALVELKHSDDA